MNCVGKFGMCFLIILNLVFMITGSLLVYGGVLFQSEGASLGGEYLTILQDQILPLLESIGINIPGLDINMYQILDMVGKAIIASGGAVIGVAFVGLVGACCKWRLFLILYALVVMLISAAEVVVIYFISDLKSEMNDTVKGTLLDLLSTYEGAIGSPMTIAWNALFVMFKCCGVNKQSEVDDFVKSKWQSSRGARLIPGHCCKGADIVSGALYANNPCTTSPTTSNSFYDQGCYSTIEETIEYYFRLLIIACSVILLVEVIAITCSCCMCDQISTDAKNKKSRKKNVNKKTSPMA